MFTALVVAPMLFFMPLPAQKGDGVALANHKTIYDIDDACYADKACLREALHQPEDTKGTSWAPTYEILGNEFTYSDCGFLYWRCIVTDIMYFLFVAVPAFIFGLSGILFDVFTAFSLSSTVIKNAGFVNEGWVIMRDLSNTFFIFILLYIAIATILQLAGGQTKRLLATLVVVALLMNFSLYITKFVIDVGNVFALEFYVNMGTENPGYIKLSDDDIIPRNIHTTFSNTFNIQRLYADDVMKSLVGNLPLTAVLFLLVGVMYLVAIFVFMTAGVLFLARVVAFWFLMILSPLAFFSYILPFTQGKVWNRWSSELVNQTFFAPIFLFFVYLTLILAETIQKNSLFQAGKNVDTDADLKLLQLTLVAFLTFFALITTLLAGLKIAKSMSGALGDSMTKIGQTLTGGALGAGLTAVGLGGRWASRLARLGVEANEKDWQKSRIGRGTLAALKFASSGSWDARNIPGIGKGASKLASMAGLDISLGQGFGKGGQAGSVAEKQKAFGDEVKRLLAIDPAAAANYAATHEVIGNRDTIGMMGQLSATQRSELIAAAKTPKERDRLEKASMALSGRMTEKQKKADEKAQRAGEVENAKSTIEEFESLKTEAERTAYINDLVNGNPTKNIKPLNDQQKLALYKSMSAAQRAEARNMNPGIFSGIVDERDLTREELSRIQGQDKKYLKEDVLKAKQKNRTGELNDMFDTIKRMGRAATDAEKNRVKDLIGEMGDREFAELEESLLTHELMIPHITPEDIAKIEKENRLSRSGRDDLYQKIRSGGHPNTQGYLRNKESGGLANGARRGRFRGSGGSGRGTA